MKKNVNQVNDQSNVHDAVINPSYGYGFASFIAQNQPQYRSKIVSNINSTVGRGYSKVDNNWVLNSGVAPIRNDKATPPACYRQGSSFSEPQLIYNFLNPKGILFKEDGKLVETQEIPVTQQCGINGPVSEPRILKQNASSSSEIVGFNYVRNIFDNAVSNKSDEVGIYELGSGSAFLAKAPAVGAKDTTKFEGFIPVSKKVNIATNILNPSQSNNNSSWTKAFREFFDFFQPKQNNPVVNPNPVATPNKKSVVIKHQEIVNTNNPNYNLTDFDQRIATSLLEPIDNELRIDEIPTSNLVNIIKNLVNSKKIDITSSTANNAAAGSGQQAPVAPIDINNTTIPDKIAQNIYKIIFYQWQKKSASANDNNTIKNFDQVNAELSANNYDEVKSIVGNEDKDMFQQLTETQKFIFTSTDPNIRKIVINAFKGGTTLNDGDKKLLFDTATAAIKDAIISNNNTRSSDQVTAIKDFIIKHNLWNVNYVLDRFQFTDPITKETKVYQVNNNNIRSIVVNQSNDDSDQTNNSSNQTEATNANAAPVISYKIIQSNDQPDVDYVDRLIIQSGNPLIYRPSYNNYQILQNWLNWRNFSRNIPVSQEIPFIELLIRAKYTSTKIRDTFQAYLAYLKDKNNVALTPQQKEEITDYLNQIENGFWNYNGYQLNFNFTSVDFFRPLIAIDSPLQKITQIPAPASITDTTAHFVVVSPEFARRFNKTPVSNEIYNTFKSLANAQTINEEQWEEKVNNFVNDPKNEQYVLNAGGLKSIIVGIGITADFVFPSISLFNLIPNPSNEALIYTNSNGYSRFLARNPAGTPENYVAISVPSQIKAMGLTKQFLTELAAQINNYGNDQRIFYNADDTSMTFSASAYRLVFVDRIVQILNLTSYLLIIIVVVLTLFGVVVLIRRYFNNYSKVFGNLGANGASKLTIILSSILFVTIPAVLGPILGYFIGLLTQSDVFKIVANYWFLDSTPADFSFLTLIGHIAVPLAILAGVAIIASVLTLKASSLNLIRENPIFKQNRFSLKVNSLFNSLTPLWKFRLIVVNNSMPRILLLSGMSSLMMMILIFTFSNIGQFTKVASHEISTKKFDYAVQYTTPTSEYRQTPLLSYNQLGQTYLNNISQKVPALYFDQNNEKLNKLDFDVNPNNPLLVSSNINNYFQNSVNKFAQNYKTEISTNPALALTNLNKELHFDPAKTNSWVQNSILSNFLLRSEWDATNKRFKSNSLPKLDSNNAKQHIFYYSSPQARQLKVSSNNQNTNIVNARSIEEHQNAFAPDISKDSSEFYYADYVPVKAENTDQKDGNKVVLAPDGTPLFQPLADLYKNKAPLLKNNNGTNKEYVSYTTSSEKEYSSRWMTENEDFHEFTYTDPNAVVDPNVTTDNNTSADPNATAGTNGVAGGNGVVDPSTNNSAGGSGNNGANAGGSGGSAGGNSVPDSNNAQSQPSAQPASPQPQPNPQPPTNQKKIKLPHLNRLYRDNANYWIFSIDDRIDAQKNLNFLLNRVLVKILLDNTIEFNDFGLKLRVNLWDIINPILQQVSPAILNQIDNNNIRLIRNIISSRYGAFFINRFFTMHQLQYDVKDFNDGDSFNGRPSYLIKPEDITKINSNSNDSENKLTPGLYYLDGRKTVYLYLNPFQNNNDHKPENRYSYFALFRPDFLYLILSILNDPAFAHPDVGPTKISLGDQVVLADYSNPTKQWTTTGIPETDAQQNVGLTASSFNSEIKYDQVLNGDQTFTYINGNFSNQQDNSHIIGLKQDARGSYIHLTDENGKTINQLLYQDIETTDDNQPVYPIIVNLFTAKKYNLHLNQLLTFKANNITKRFADRINRTNSSQNVIFKVVGFNEAYYQTAYFISQKNANTILGLNSEYGYNGLFTKQDGRRVQPIQFTSAFSVFANSGIYNPIQFDPSSAATKELLLQPQTQIGRINIPSNIDNLRARFNIPSNLVQVSDIITFLRNVYGDLAINPWITNLNDSNTTNLLFDRLSNTVQSFVSIILIIFIPLLIIMVLMVTSLMIDDLKQLSVIMIMLGFNNWENTVTILTYLLPVLTISLVVSMPLAVLFLQTYIGIILNSVALLLPIKLLAWYFLSSIGVLLTIFASAFFQSYFKLKKIFLPVAMKIFAD
ncbi:ABC transporter permease [[Mycoplasma] cavipharyngis]|uniref:ABC transporter permease n=1 Tax=[Mycoplasma] cavipharyngis TaxID=92757 RepID=UPI003703A630